jgi:hypothetical protein
MCQSFDTIWRAAPYQKAPDRFALKFFQMESCVMSEPPKFEFHFWGCRVSAQGVIGIVAAVSVVAMVLAFYRF